MSLREVYTLAHTAQCRLQMEASRPERNLRFVVGHLMHYEHLRLRILEIEHDVSKSQRARAVQFQGTGIDHTLQHKPSANQLRKSPPPTTIDFDSSEDEEDEEEDDYPFLDDEDSTADLSLSRFPSGSSRPPIVPDLEPDDNEEDYSDEDEPVSPTEPTPQEISTTIHSEPNALYAKMYEGVRQCPCHGNQNAPEVYKIWELPPDQENAKDGVTRALAQVREEGKAIAVDVAA